MNVMRRKAAWLLVGRGAPWLAAALVLVGMSVPYWFGVPYLPMWLP